MTANELKLVKLSEHFWLHEFFSKDMCMTNSVIYLQMLIDPRIIRIMEKIRTDFDRSVYVNGWYYGLAMEYRGFREPSSPYYSPGSAHSFGQAVDYHITGIGPKEMRQYLLDNEKDFMLLGLTRIENPDHTTTSGTGWTHIDVKHTGKDHIHTFNP